MPDIYEREYTRAIMRLRQFQRETYRWGEKVETRTNKMTNSLKLQIWIRVLEENDCNRLADHASRRLATIVRHGN